ncbi:MAG: helix-turn-helix domain-containing protein [Aquisalimonadaceae bacterium]
MKTYGQFCPVAKAAELFCERWTPLIIRDLAGGASRYTELRKGVPLMSPALLSRRLKQLEAEGVVERRRSASGRYWTYHLTPAGLEFVPMIAALGSWGQRWSRRELADYEIDVGLLLWSMEQSVAPAAFGPQRNVVRLELPDQPVSKRHWWFVNDSSECELCLKDPGFEIDLFLRVTLKDMTYIWRGDLALPRALEKGRLEAHGPMRARRALRAWLNLKPVTRIASQRSDAPVF